MQCKQLGAVIRTPNHDAFGLAIAIFLLLFIGRHPFVGTLRKGEIPPLHEAIRDFRYEYAENRDVGMDQPPGTPTISEFSPRVASAFEMAFSKDGVKERPSTAEWVVIPEELESSLVKCRTQPLHFIPRGPDDCPWCDMESALGTILFLPYLPDAVLTTAAFDPGAAGFNVDLVWSQINSIGVFTQEKLLPKLAAFQPTTSSDVIAAKSTAAIFAGMRWAAVGVAAVLLFVFLAGWFIWAPLALLAFNSAKDKKQIDTTPIRNKYVEIERRWGSELESWKRRTGIQELLQQHYG